jgi:hypothetical protein
MEAQMSQNENTPINEIQTLNLSEILALAKTPKVKKAVGEREDKVTFHMLAHNDVEKLNTAMESGEVDAINEAAQPIIALLLVRRNFPDVYNTYKVAYRQANPKKATA